MTLETQKVRLTTISEDDVPTLFAWRNDPTYLEMCTSRGPVSFEVFKAEFESEFEANRLEQLSIRSKTENALIGTIYAYNHRPEDAYCLVTLFIEEGSRDAGYGPEALAIFVEHLFKEYGLFKIYMEVYDTNAKSLALLTRFGFRAEGRFVNQHKTPSGRCDVIRFAIFQEDRERIRAFLGSSVAPLSRSAGSDPSS